MSAGAKQDFATWVGKCAAYMWVSEWGAGVARQSGLISDWWQLCDWCNGGWECVSAVHDGRCSPWVMCSCSVVRGNQIRDMRHTDTDSAWTYPLTLQPLATVSEPPEQHVDSGPLQSKSHSTFCPLLHRALGIILTPPFTYWTLPNYEVFCFWESQKCEMSWL